mgnify:CR=1 FL=1
MDMARHDESVFLRTLCGETLPILRQLGVEEAVVRASWPVNQTVVTASSGARAASALGVHIIENCEVTGFVIEDGKCSGVETSRGRINAGKVGIDPKRAGFCIAHARGPSICAAAPLA